MANRQPDDLAVLVIGSGGREHALVAALDRDPRVRAVHAGPGNPGTARVATNHPIAISDGNAVAKLAAELGVDLVVIGPEAPLVAGVADAVRAAGIACFGPSAASARLEGSKAFAKDVMAAAGVPTARAMVCQTPAEAAAALDRFGRPYVVKDDGLAAGKGVIVTGDRQEALRHALACGRVVIEEYLDGPEVSLFGVTDGTTVLPLQPAQDFKRVGDGDRGPNTGGMGSYSPVPGIDDSTVQEIAASVHQPIVDELRSRGTPFHGVLYAGLMMTAAGPKVLEFNARFGDPETQAILPRLRSDVLELLDRSARPGGLEGVTIDWSPDWAVTLVMASAGYPESSSAGDAITGLDEAAATGAEITHAGTAEEDGQIVTAGGRVLNVTALGTSPAEARERAYEAAGAIGFQGMQMRTDIAARAVERVGA